MYLPCKSCEVGKHFDTPSTLCVDCKLSHYQDEIGSTSATCKICNAGQFTPQKGQAACKQCSAGLYLDDPRRGRFKCLTCTTPNSPRGAVKCFGCGLGRFGYFREACNDCPQGWFAEGGDKKSCKECPAGFHGGATHKRYECDDCLAGRWSDQILATDISACVACAKGKYSKIRASRVMSVCKQCESGKWNGVEGADHDSMCLNCERGRFGTDFGRTIECQGCANGKFKEESGSKTDCKGMLCVVCCVLCVVCLVVAQVPHLFLIHSLLPLLPLFPFTLFPLLPFFPLFQKLARKDM
jgi:hypothetical protein